MVARNRPGTLLVLTVFRNGKIEKLQAILDILPSDDEQALEPQRGPRPMPAPDGSTPPSAPNLGLVLEDAQGGGAVVREVKPGSVADGLLARGDIIVEVNKARVSSSADATKRMEGAKGGVVILTVKRGEDQRFVALRVK